MSRCRSAYPIAAPALVEVVLVEAVVLVGVGSAHLVKHILVSQFADVRLARSPLTR